MKNYYLFIAFCFALTTQSQSINFADANFKAEILSSLGRNFNGEFISIDANHNGEIEVSEAQQIQRLYISPYNAPIRSISGVEYFTNLEEFTLHINGNMVDPANIDISVLPNLKSFNCVAYTTGTLTVNGLSNLTKISVRGFRLGTINLAGLPNLQVLSLDECALTSIDLSVSTNITNIFLANNPLLTSINVSPLTNTLQTLFLINNSFTTLDVSGMTLLTDLVCDGNLLTSLNLSGAVNLEDLRCEDNLLPTLDVSTNTNLSRIACDNNQLTTLDISANTHLSYLYCSENHLTDLDFSNANFLSIRCNANNLVSMNLKNNFYDGEVHQGSHGSTYGELEFNDNPNLQYICLDDIETTYVQGKIAQYGYANCHTNGYCSFNPGGTFYTIEGHAKFDADANGCDVGDINFPLLKFGINDGTATTNIITDTSGNYTIPVQAGTYTVTPIFENPSYFLVSPESATVTFPAETSPFIQNFCITPQGVHNDLEVNIIPINQARPGFDAKYKIVYKNKGNQTQSGTVSLAYNDAVIDFVSASVAPSSQPMNYINWNFTNLQPFETKEFFITFNVNSPVETPPVNGGFVLNYTLCINSGLIDETPADNIFVLHQTVVNSFDPNDKICLEGNTIAPEMIGKYVHYVIHFENTGNANAENIVVKDKIDTTKFDISSLVPIAGSHPFVTKISDTNKVEFIFENINLPYDDTNNDGFIAFKIKTNSTISAGDSFSNSASIYFDFNAPINTEPAVTAVQLLADDSFEFGNTITITPNPADDMIQISNVADPEFEVQISNLLGKVVLQKNNRNLIDVSGLAKGVYFISINQGNRTITKKLIKN